MHKSLEFCVNRANCVRQNVTIFVPYDLARRSKSLVTTQFVETARVFPRPNCLTQTSWNSASRTKKSGCGRCEMFVSCALGKFPGKRYACMLEEFVQQSVNKTKPVRRGVFCVQNVMSSVRVSYQTVGKRPVDFVQQLISFHGCCEIHVASFSNLKEILQNENMFVDSLFFA